MIIKSKSILHESALHCENYSVAPSFAFFSEVSATPLSSALRLEGDSSTIFFFFLTTMEVKSLTGISTGVEVEDEAFSSLSRDWAANAGAFCTAGSLGVVFNSSTFEIQQVSRVSR